MGACFDMWNKLSHSIIKYRLPLLGLIGLITLFMGYHGLNAEMTYNYDAVVPKSDPQMIEMEKFRNEFGQDGTIVAFGIQDSSLFTPENFKKYFELSKALKEVEHINEVISLPLIQKMVKAPEGRKFNLVPIFEEIPTNQKDLDSLLTLADEQKFFSQRLINKESGAVMMLVSISGDVINSPVRVSVTKNITKLGEAFEKDTGIKMRYAGLPFVRSVISGQITQELKIFLSLSVAVTGLILLLFFRTWDAFVFPMIIIGVVIVWVFGTVVLFGFKVNMLSGLVPPLIVVIGIPNSVYLTNKYHQEFEAHGNKVKAISIVVRKIGLVTLITNFTTAIGFLVLISTDIVVLKEFGIIAGINILATFLVSIILIPAVFYWLPPPTTKQLHHLKFKPLDWVLTWMDTLVHRNRTAVYVITIAIVIAAFVGMSQVKAVSFIVDDIPEDSPIRQDMMFFEDQFSGIMPMEIVVDTKKKRGITQLSNIRKINELEKMLEAQPEISQPLSMISLIKATRQAFYNNNPDRYDIPSNNRERGFLLRYLNNDGENMDKVYNFVDTSFQKMRVSMQVADIGSDKMDELINQRVRPQIDSIFTGTDIDVTITGTTPLFVQGNKFLIENLRNSLLLAFIVIAITMGVLFANIRMILISIIPNIIPLILTAGLMGYFNIPLKPSTALVFSIAFGISVDDSIHYLAKYRQELFANKFFVPFAVSKSIRETGASMVYTSIILFSGFVIFAGSNFGGTVALGILTSTTLLFAMLTNLILLPSLIMTFDDGKRKVNKHPIIEQYDSSFYSEDDDEEIDLDKLELNKSEMMFIDSNNKKTK